MSAKLRKVMRLTVAFVIAFPNLVGCVVAGKKPETTRELRGIGMIVDSALYKDASLKVGVEAFSDAGNVMFMFPLLTSIGGSESSFGPGTNMSFPRWVQVTWRKGPIKMNYQNNGFVGGIIIGEYKVEVLSRIPADVFKYAAATRGRVIVLRFRIKDDGVLLAWDVQERVIHPSGGRGVVFSMHGGDFPCENSLRTEPDCTSGRLEDAPWYNPLWTRG